MQLDGPSSYAIEMYFKTRDLPYPYMRLHPELREEYPRVYAFYRDQDLMRHFGEKGLSDPEVGRAYDFLTDIAVRANPFQLENDRDLILTVIRSSEDRHQSENT